MKLRGGNKIKIQFKNNNNLHSIIALITSKSKARGILAGVPLSCAADGNGIPTLDSD